MDRHQVRREVERTFARGNKDELYQKLRTSELSPILDVLWDYMEEADGSLINKRELAELREKIKAMNNKSGQRVRCLEVLPERRALVKLGPLAEEVLISPSVDISKIKKGTELLVIGTCDGRMVAGVREPSIFEGRFSKVQKILDKNRVILEDGGHGIIATVVDGLECKEGDEVRYDLDGLLVLEVIKSEEAAFSISEYPTTTLDDVKGLEEEKKALREKIIYPVVHKEKFDKYGLQSIHGALFFGPPGCGKTMLAGAIFNEISKLKSTENTDGFFVINGPELLSKWAGNTEQAIRNIFQEARKANKKTGVPSIIFWDEIESITGRRKDTATYTPEKTVVPQLLAELQGLKSTENVVLIGATNRPDLMDPALMRPGRLGDAIIEIPRPDKQGAKEILEAALRRPELPSGVQNMLDKGAVEISIVHVYDNAKPLAFKKTRSGKTIPILRSELANGAIFAQMGEEIIRQACMAEIYHEDPPSVEQAVQVLDNIMLSQIGVLDAGSKNGFTFDTSDYVIDVSLNA